MSYFLEGFGTLLTPHYLIFMFVGVALGMILGFLPGLAGSLGIALMIPFTYKMDALTALVFLLSIYTGGLFGGAVTSITINVPGSANNMMTTLDGYPMYRQGKGAQALGMALMASFIGGVIGCTFLASVCKPLAGFALKFGPSEMFMVMFFGICCVGSLSDKPLKSLFSGLFGVLLGTVGMSGATGVVRGTHGAIYLLDGIPTVPVMAGLLALPSVMMLVRDRHKKYDLDKSATSLKSIIHGFKEVVIRPIQTVLCSLLGVAIGVVPAAGATIASALSYNQAKQWLGKKKAFGTGIPEGIVASETANNASEGGALATMFVLGIPGSSASAMMIAALVIQGWALGPKMFIDHQDVIYTAFSSLFMQQIVMLILGLVLCLCASYVIKIPNRYLVPCVLVFVLIGAFSSRAAVFDMGLLIAFGILGFLMRKSEYPAMAMILGVLLGGDADANRIRISQSYDHFYEIFQSPITTVMCVIAVFCLVFPLYTHWRKSRNSGAGRGPRP